MPLSICMFSNLYYPVVSGSSTHTANLSHELVKRGHRVVIITSRLESQYPEYEEVDGVKIYRLPAFRLPKLPISLNFPWLNMTFTLKNILRIKKILAMEKPDILHLHNHMFDLGFSAALMEYIFKIPLVITIHTVIKHTRPLYNLFLYPADRFLINNLIVRRAKLLICPDVNIQLYVQEAFKHPNFTIIPYGIRESPQIASEKINAIRSQWNLDGKKVILSLGHVNDLRNRKDLIDAMSHILRVIPDAVLLLVGGVDTPLPAEQARRLGIEKHVILIGAGEHDEIFTYLALADLEAHWGNQDPPEKISLGIASLEAMSAGKTVLAAANPDTYGKGILINDKNILIVESGKPETLAQKIIDLLYTPERCELIGKNASQTIRDHFSWDSVCKKTIQAYESVI